jgi:hypothetical protein
MMLLFALGCGKAYQVAPVSGRVTLEGKPMGFVTVSFSSKADKTWPSAVGVTDEEGKFTLQLATRDNDVGAIVGDNNVLITGGAHRGAKKVIERGPPRSPVPAKYGTDGALSFTVPPRGTSEANFELTSK